MKRSIFSLTIALLILSIGICPEVTQAQAKKDLNQAAVDGDLERVKVLVSAGADINSINRMSMTPLVVAAWNNHKDVCEFLIEKGADLNAKDRSSRTAIYFAVQKNNKELVELLVKKGADVNITTTGSENAYSLAKKNGNTEIADFLAKNGATDPVVVQPGYEDELYGPEGMSPPGPGRAPRQGVTPNVPQPPVQVDLLADPNEIMARIKTFAGLEKIILELGKKSAIEMKYWGQSRSDNRTTLARYVQKQIEDEFAEVKKIAIEEKAAKTAKAIDDLLKKKEDRYSKIRKELMQQRREAMAGARTSSRSRGRSRGSSRSYGRGSSTGSTSGGYATGGGYSGGSYGGYGEGDMGMSGRGSYGRTTARPEEQLDRETQEEIRQWMQTTLDKKVDLAKAIHPMIYADFALIRKVAVEEEAKKTTAAIDGILLARQVRFDVYVKMTEALMQAATQDPRLIGQPGNQNMQPGTTRRGRGTSSRTTGRRRR